MSIKINKDSKLEVSNKTMNAWDKPLSIPTPVPKPSQKSLKKGRKPKDIQEEE